MGKTAFLFSGQGAQYPGMMKDLYEYMEPCRRVFQIADAALNRSISNLCFNGSQTDLNLTHNTQPCVLAADLAAYYAIRQRGIKPDVAAGFSVGEYAALTAAEVIKIEDVFPLIQLRADLMQEAVPVGKGAMAAVAGENEASVREMCDFIDGYVEPSNYNCPGQIVVSGEAEAVKQLVSHIRSKKGKAMLLPVSAPFHCKLMKPAARQIVEALDKITFESPVCPVYMNVDAGLIRSAEGIREKVIEQVKAPVLWEQILRNMYADGFDTFVEAGPGKTLSGFVKKTFKGIEGIHILRVSDLETFEQTIRFLEERKKDDSGSV